MDRDRQRQRARDLYKRLYVYQGGVAHFATAEDRDRADRERERDANELDRLTRDLAPWQPGAGS